jgi:pimeloyl-ACP methyl ester carboxylesterase
MAATSAGVRLYYVEAGAGEPPLVFVHGWCCEFLVTLRVKA